MKLKLKSETSKVFNWWLDNDGLIINLHERWTYKSFKQKKNQLFITLKDETIEFRFTTGEPPKLKFEYQEKDQIIFNYITKRKKNECINRRS